MKLNELKTLWDDFGNVPVNNEDEIEEDFIIDLTDTQYIEFERGTYKFDVWDWFDEQCPNNLHDDLMFPKG